MNSHTGQKNQATVREVTLELLRSFGITTVFGNPGSTELAFFKDWPRDFRYILGLQEAAVVAMADGTVTTQYAPDPTALQAIADALNTSKNPALIVGAGVDQDHAWEQVIELAEHTHARVWASPLSGHASFPEDHSQFAGFLPPVRSELARTLEGHDVLIALACPVFTYHVSSGGPVIPQGSRLFQITDDVASTTWAPIGTSIITTIQLGLKTLLPLIKETRRPIPPARQAVPTPRPTDPISAAFVMHTVAQLMPADAIIVEEVPSHRNDLHDYLARHSPFVSVSFIDRSRGKAKILTKLCVSEALFYTASRFGMNHVYMS